MVYNTITGVRVPGVPSIYKSSQSCSNGDLRSSSLPLFLKPALSRRIYTAKVYGDSDSSSSRVVASEKVIIPEIESDGSSVADQIENSGILSENAQNVDALYVDDEKNDKASSDVGEIEDVLEYIPYTTGVSGSIEGVATSIAVDVKESIGKDKVKPKIVPPPGTGEKIYEIDPLLLVHRSHLDYRYSQYRRLREEIDRYEGGLEVFSRGYEKLGFTSSVSGITYREWAPGAKSASLIGDFNNWNPNADAMTGNEFGVWEIFLPNNADGSPSIPHGSRVKEVEVEEINGTGKLLIGLGPNS